jgi:hypothetical protein
LDQQHEELFFGVFHDPFADFMQSMRSMYVKVFLSDENFSLSYAQTTFLLAIHSFLFQVKIKKRFSKSISDMASLEA